MPGSRGHRLEGELKAKHGVSVGHRPHPIHEATKKRSASAAQDGQPQDPNFVHDLVRA